ncbi:MAG: hypothetical protein VW258_05485, partial [Thalassolituus sp.]
KQSTTTPINTNSASEDNTSLLASNMSEVLHSVKTLGADVLATTDSAEPHSRAETALETTAATIPETTQQRHSPDDESATANMTSPEANFAEPEKIPALNWAFNTEHGGVLFLLNFLNREPAQAIVRDYWAQLPNGWLWLLGLAAELSATLSDDPLYDFIRAQAGLEEALYLPLPEDSQLSGLAKKLYGEEVWTPELLALPASIQATPDHVNLMADISRTDISLRLAGLDLDPGWMPWLGQVVRFYFEPGYDNSRHLR